MTFVISTASNFCLPSPSPENSCSSSTFFLQVLRGLPLFLPLSGWCSSILLGHLLFLIHCMCPYHINLRCSTVPLIFSLTFFRSFLTLFLTWCSQDILSEQSISTVANFLYFFLSSANT